MREENQNTEREKDSLGPSALCFYSDVQNIGVQRKVVEENLASQRRQLSSTALFPESFVGRQSRVWTYVVEIVYIE